MSSSEGSGVSVTVFQNAHVFDGHRYRGDVGDVVVEGGRIVTVGASGTPSGATVVDVGGGLLAPGFVDAHVHAIQGGLERLACDLSGVPVDEAAYLAHVGSYAASHPDTAWIRGGGWAMAAFPGGVPSARALDAVVPDRPVALVNRDHHGMWVNTRALEVAGIHAGTPDPPDGRFERDEAGNPTGMLHEGAMRWVDEVLPVVDDDAMLAGFLEGQSYLHSFGVTAWQDAIVGAYAGMQDNGPTYLRAAQEGLISGTVVGALWWDRDRGAEQVADLVERRSALSHGRFSATAVKIMQDGIIENGTAGLAEPYLDRCGHHTDNAGISFVDPAQLPAYIAALDRLGFQVHVHGIGDRGVHEALDAFEGTDPARRHHIAHLQLIEPDDIPRFHALGVAANLQALWACLDEQMTELTIPFLGAERAGRQYPFADLLRSGARLVAGSDWPVSTPNPLEAIHVAVHRVDHGGLARGGMEPFLPEQALPIEAAFAAYTSGSSWVNHRDDAGTIAPGAVADLVVLDRDPFLAPDSIGAAQVVSTWVDGEVVHQA
ncbi:amidohydrolase [Nocardioides pocheonensis]|uniref:Amidohydrolase n=1 Tax=Nocardioides pocheonensis TaxID=661485 RepID=A0A3N0GNG6_9ACTN|nr:amidohydrolase [Nocardioides pocheonensis]